jgi:hypothetical protein
MSEDNPFEGTVTPAPASVKFDDLVGEGKKYKTTDDAAIAIMEKDHFIEQLKRENAEMREASSKRMNEEEFLAKLAQATAPKTPEPQDPPVERRVEQVASAVTPEDIDKIIDQREAKRSREQNLNSVVDRLQELYGDEFKSRVQSQAKELGVGTTFLTNIASENPQAFYRLMGIEAPKRQDTFSPPPPTRVNTANQTQPSGKKDYGHFQKLRSEKGDGWYFSIPVQQEIWQAAKEAEKRGERFLPE